MHACMHALSVYYFAAGVEPHQLLDFFSLVGDRADGIVGCRGIGAAAARKLLQAVESLEVSL